MVDFILCPIQYSCWHPNRLTSYIFCAILSLARKELYMSFEEEKLAVLKQTVGDLNVELSGNPSPQKVAGFVNQVVLDALGYCGPGIFLEFGKKLLGCERAENGFCKICPGSPRPTTDVDDLCDECRVKFKAETDQMFGAQKEPAN